MKIREKNKNIKSTIFKSDIIQGLSIALSLWALFVVKSL